jgi:hypothetical protein
VKKIKQSYPRRAAMLRTAFEPLSEDEFRRLVADGSAVPSHQGSVLFVSKWRDGPGDAVDEFLTALHAQGSKLVARTYQKDVNIRVVLGKPAAPSPKGPSAKARKSAN